MPTKFSKHLCLFVCSALFPLLLQAQPYETSDDLPLGVKLANVNYDQHQMHYAFSGNAEAPGVLFIHGTPGSWQAFSDYLGSGELQEDYFLVSIDRLGWGQSKINQDAFNNNQPGNARNTYDFSVQAESIAAVMRRYPGKKWLLVGHSLGASIAPKVALLEQENVSGLLLLAGSHKPSLGRARWYNLAANTMLVRWMLPASLRYSNDEIMVLKKELLRLENELAEASLKTDVVVIQGMKDRLVSPKNAPYAALQWKSTFTNLKTIEVPEAGHFLPWQHAPLIEETIRQLTISAKSPN